MTDEQKTANAQSLTTTAQLPKPYAPAAAGPSAVWSSLRYAQKTSGLRRGLHVFLSVNQKEGFDCPGCAWPDPDHRATAEFCENGARAVTHEADARIVDAAFFAAHSITSLRERSDHWLEQQGRLVAPMIKRPGSAHYEPISWDDAFTLVGNELRALDTPDRAVFYTSGRASNEAAFLYQLFARAFGTNNLPDCSNMCHESSGKGLGATLGVGKGTVQLADFDASDCILVIGQNPGTNHPRMLSTLQQAARRGAAIIAINPLRERALESFAHPQKGLGPLGVGTNIATQYLQVRINGDVALLKGIMKVVFHEERRTGGVLDRVFIEAHTAGFDDYATALAEVGWDEIVEQSGVGRADIERAAQTFIRAQSVIACWAMGLTQHENGVDNIREVVNLLLLRGMIGKPGAGVCPVRGHSNVQGDRTMGIIENPSEEFLARLDEACDIQSPRAHGFDVVGAIHAMEAGDANIFVGLGGNFVAATPDTPRVDAALQRCRLTVQISTKLNRSHVACGEHALILPCLGRSEIDAQASGTQFVTVENSMGVVHRSEGRLKPASPKLRSEPAIIAGLATATLGADRPLRWADLVDSYDRTRDLIERVIPGFSHYNQRVRTDDGFVLPNRARERSFDTTSGKANFSVVPLPVWRLRDGELLLMTIRSHDQFNTTIYEESDRYRGVYGKRRVLFIHPDDIAKRDLAPGDAVEIRSHHDGAVRSVSGFEVVPYDIPQGCVAGYFPELNPLVPLEHHARESRTPASKSVVVTVHGVS